MNPTLHFVFKLLRTHWGAQLALAALLLWFATSLLLFFQPPDYSGTSGSGAGYLSWSYWTDHVLREKSDAESSEFAGLAVDSSGHRLWLATDHGILGSINDGDTWTWQYRPDDAGYPDIGFVDLFLLENRGGLLESDRTLWAVANNGHVLISTNDGDSLEGNPGCTESTAEPGTASAKVPKAVFFADREHGWLVGKAGLVCSSEDGGKSWAPQNLGQQAADLNAVHFVDPQHGWIAGAEGNLWATADAGKTWNKQVPPLPSAYPDSYVQALQRHPSLYAIRFQDARIGWIVGERGAILATNDGGKNWTVEARAMPLTGAETLHQIAARHTPEAGTRLWAASDHRLLFRDGDNKDWELVQDFSNNRETIGHIRFGERDRGWVSLTGNPPTVLRTGNSGWGWDHRVAPAPYQLASGYGYATAGCLILFLFGCWQASRHLQPGAGEKTDPISALFHSDRPQRGEEQDALGTRSLAWAISRFLRHRATEPPLTIAITAPWGGGKSSLMNWLREDIERFGYHPIWFNAWHYEKQEQMFPALMEQIRNGALPSLFSGEGLWFRLLLLWGRMLKHPAWSLIFLAILAFGYGYFEKNRAAIENELSYRAQCYWEDAFHKQPPDARHRWLETSECERETQPAPGQGGKNKSDSRPASVLDYWQLLLGTPLIGLLRWLRAFQRPDTFLSKLLDNSEEGKSRHETSVKERFAADFALVTRALPKPMVIFIDDLDRCQPRSVCEVLEVVNFLYMTGRCYVVFGMWQAGVEQAVGLGFAESAMEHALLKEGPLRDSASEAGRAEIRRQYGRLYLEKLVNIWVPVPAMTVGATENLLVREHDRIQPESTLRTLLGYLSGAAKARLDSARRLRNLTAAFLIRLRARETWCAAIVLACGKRLFGWLWFLIRWILARLVWMFGISAFAVTLGLAVGLAAGFLHLRYSAMNSLKMGMGLSYSLQLLFYCFRPSRWRCAALLEILPQWLRLGAIRNSFHKDNCNWAHARERLHAIRRQVVRFVALQGAILTLCYLLAANAEGSQIQNRLGLIVAVAGLLYCLPTRRLYRHLLVAARLLLPSSAPPVRPAMRMGAIIALPAAVILWALPKGADWPPDLRSPYHHEQATPAIAATPPATASESVAEQVLGPQLPATPLFRPDPSEVSVPIVQKSAALAAPPALPVTAKPASSRAKQAAAPVPILACRSQFPIPPWRDAPEIVKPLKAEPPPEPTQPAVPSCQSPHPIPSWQSVQPPTIETAPPRPPMPLS